jgi:hypothetical protein
MQRHACNGIANAAALNPLVLTGSNAPRGARGIAFALGNTIRSGSGNRKTNAGRSMPGYTPGSGLTDLGGNPLPTTTFASGWNSRF